MADALRQILGTLATEAVDKLRRPPAGTTATVVMPPAVPTGQAAPPPSAAWPSVAPPASSPTARRAQGHSPIDASTLRMLEQKLIAYLGPIARVMVRSAAGPAVGPASINPAITSPAASRWT